MNPFLIQNFFEIIYKGAAEYHRTTKSFAKIRASFKRTYNISFLENLPEFNNGKMELSNKFIEMGSIIKRPLNVPWLSSVAYHYGIVLGTSIDGRELILEMSKHSDIRVVSKADFLDGFKLESIKIVSQPRKIDRNEIINRAKTIEFEVYDFFDLNCIDFAFFCVYDLKPKKRSELFFK